METKKKCKEIEKFISEYIDNQLQDPLKQMIEEHIKICNRCFALLDSLEKTIELSKKLYKKHSVPKIVNKRVFYQVKIRFKK